MALSPSDPEIVFSLLTRALSADPNVRGSAETALSQCESQPGFCSCLMEVITAKNLAIQADIRLLASVYFKNSISRHWRNRRDSLGVNNEEKIHLRRKLLSHLSEGNYQIAEQLAVLISKVARFDYPRDWPELFSVLTQQLQSADNLTSHRIFMIIFRTLKELSTKRLAVDQKIFEQISSHFFEYGWHLWKIDAQTILQTFSALTQSIKINDSAEQQDDLHLICERWLLCSKIVRQITVLGFPSDAKSAQVVQQVKEVCPVIFKVVQSLLPFYSDFGEKYPDMRHFIARACIKLMKILVVLQERQPYSFADEAVLSPIMDFCLRKILAADFEILSFEQFLIQCMVVIKSLLECKEYKLRPVGHVISEDSISLNQLKCNLSSAANSLMKSLLSDECAVLLCNVLIRRYFVLTSGDLDEWDHNAEVFHHEQDMVQWTERLRPCAEALFITLFENYSQLLGPVVVSILHEVIESCSVLKTDITPEMLLKDAAYTAAGHAYYQLSSFLQFDDWFKGQLSHEIANDHSNMRVIRRRVAFVLGQWASEIKADVRKPVYFAVIRLLDDKDLAVKLTACWSLCFLVDDINFHIEDFMEFLPLCWDLCFNLLQEVHEFDSKVQVLNSVSLLIERATKQVIPFGNKLVHYFWKAWEEAIGESLLEIHLLTAFRNFVGALGYHSPICYNILLPILQTCIDINHPDALNLLEDAVLLWETAISHAPSMIAQLMELFPYLPAILEKKFDLLKAVVGIIEGYAIVGGIEFIRSQASNIVKILDSIINEANDRGLLSTFPVIELMIQRFPAEAPSLINHSLQRLIVVCLSGGDDLEPSRTSVKAYAGAILARLLVMNSNYFAHLTGERASSLSLQCGVPGEQNLILSVADVWLDKIDNMTVIQKRCCVLALSITLSLRVNEVLDKLDHILSICTSVLLGGLDDGGEEYASQNMTSIETGNECAMLDAASIRDLRIRQIRDSDPIKQLSLEASLKENIQACAFIHGESTFNAAISRMHPTAFRQLQQALHLS